MLRASSGENMSGIRAWRQTLALFLGASCLFGTAPLGASAPADPPGLCDDSATTIVDGPTGAIPDLATTTFNVQVSGVGTLLWDVDVIAAISHTATADLDIK